MQACGTTPASEELCDPNPCVGLHQTVCLVVNDEPECYCDPGYVMDQDKGCVHNSLDPCDPNPCTQEHKTRCHDEDGLAVCSCESGYELNQEEKCVPITPCVPNPCREPHKTVCTEDGTKANCSCDDNYLDLDGSCVRPCDMPDVCPDPDRSICVNDGTSASCHCSPGFVQIENDCVDDPCDPNPCHGQHRNTCIRQGSESTCACDPGFLDVNGECTSTSMQGCSRDAWCRENPMPTGEDLTSVWAFDEQNVFWVGNSGVILHYDGSDLNLMDSGVGVDLYGIWGSSLGDIWASGEDGLLLHYDGIKWTQYQLADEIPKQNIRYLWGYGPQSVYACGDDGLLLFYDGYSWTCIETDLPNDTNLHSIWGAGPYDVYIASDFGKLLHWDGEQLSVEIVAGGAGLYHITGSAYDDIWVATMDGTLFHNDGNEWTLTDQLAYTILFCSYVDSDGVLWISGYDFVAGKGVLKRKVSGKFEDVDREPLVSYTHVTGDSTGHVFASGGLGLAMEFSDGQIHRLTKGTRRLLNGIRATGDRVLACGSTGRLISYQDATWKIISNEIQDSFHSLCFDSSGEAVLAASKGHVYWYDGSSFSMQDIGRDVTLFDLDCLDDGSIIVAGLAGTCAEMSDDQWTILDTNTELKISSVWFSSPVQGWAVGEGGLLIAYDGSGWNSVELAHPVGRDLQAVDGFDSEHVVAVGLDGRILTWDGTSWTFENSPTNNDLFGVWMAGPDDVWIAGESGTIMHNGQDGWYMESSGTRNQLMDIWGDQAGNIWTVGQGGTVLHKRR